MNPRTTLPTLLLLALVGSAMLSSCSSSPGKEPAALGSTQPPSTQPSEPKLEHDDPPVMVMLPPQDGEVDRTDPVAVANAFAALLGNRSASEGPDEWRARLGTLLAADRTVDHLYLRPIVGDADACEGDTVTRIVAATKLESLGPDTVASVLVAVDEELSCGSRRNARGYLIFQIDLTAVDGGWGVWEARLGPSL